MHSITNAQRVSILTPAWKAEAFIAETIASVQQQTYGDWEMLIVDDCSPDGTAGRVEAIAQSDPRVKLIRHAQNGGPATARNTAFQHATGRWIAMLDADDQWLPAKLERQLAFHQRVGSKLSYTAYRRINADGSRVGGLIGIPPRLRYRQLLANTAIATSTVLMDRALTGQITFKKIYYDDFGCWLDLLRDGSVAHGLDEDLMRYRVLNQSVSRNKWRSAKEVWKTYREIEHIAALPAAYYFLSYAGNAVRKYRNF